MQSGAANDEIRSILNGFLYALEACFLIFFLKPHEW